MIKAIIFDMDGLMIETEHLQSKSFEHVLKKYGVNPEFNKDGVVQMVGITAKDNIIHLKEKHHINEEVENLLDQKQQVYEELLLGNIYPKKGLMTLLKKLKENNFKLGVASSSCMEHINLVLNGLKITDYFNVVISGEQIERGKPFPDIFLTASEKLNINPELCLVLEDAQSGVEAANAANMKVIAVPNQYTNSHNFDKADRVVSSLEEVSIELLTKI